MRLGPLEVSQRFRIMDSSAFNFSYRQLLFGCPAPMQGPRDEPFIHHMQCLELGSFKKKFLLDKLSEACGRFGCVLPDVDQMVHYNKPQPRARPVRTPIQRPLETAAVPAAVLVVANKESDSESEEEGVTMQGAADLWDVEEW